MRDKTTGIVIRIQDYKDNDLLLSVLCKEYGLLSFVVKGAKKINARQRFFEGCIYEFIFDYKEFKTIFSAHSSKLIKSYYELNDLVLMSFKNIFFDLVFKSKEMVDEEMYTNLEIFLERIDSQNLYLLGSLFISYLSKVHGINANVDECVVCKNKKVVTISNTHGGFLCLEHSIGLEPLPVETLKRFRLINKAQFKDLDIIINNVYEYKDFKIIMDFFIHNSGLNVKTYEFYKSLI